MPQLRPYGVVGIPAVLMMMAAAASGASDGNRDHTFDGSISRQVLENYLSRAMTTMDLLRPPPFEGAETPAQIDDNIRMLTETGTKFAGRTIYFWAAMNNQWVTHMLNGGREIAARIHAADPDIILQGGIFECIADGEKGFGDIPIPAHVFEAFGLEPEERTFQYDAMIYPEGGDDLRNKWGPGLSVPDIGRVETRMWFYFLATSFIDVGVEAIHIGQVELMNRNDPGNRHWADLLERIRAYAAKNARRHMILFDAHVPSGGFVVDGHLLFDFHSFPLRPKATARDKPQECILEMGYLDSLYGRSKGGIAPSGWPCDSLPYLVEFDNWGASGHEGEYGHAGGYWPWGYDEIGWFAHQSPEYRREWLRYAWTWVREHDPNGYVQMPGMRCLAVPIDGRPWYAANRRSDACPFGFDVEDTIREIWTEDGAKP